jgi:hypothetical protein
MTSVTASAPPAFILDDKVGADGAQRLLANVPRGLRFWRVPAQREAGSVAALELVRLPVAIARTHPVANAGRRRVSRVRIYVVERVLGHAWALSHQLGDDDAPADRSSDCASLPPRLAIEDCRKPLDALAARAALAFGRGRPGDVAELGPLAAATYPFWLRYRRDRRGRIDFAALDAVTGARPGSALRAAIAAALIDADER